MSTENACFFLSFFSPFAISGLLTREAQSRNFQVWNFCVCVWHFLPFHNKGVTQLKTLSFFVCLCLLFEASYFVFFHRPWMDTKLKKRSAITSIAKRGSGHMVSTVHGKAYFSHFSEQKKLICFKKGSPCSDQPLFIMFI